MCRLRSRRRCMVSTEEHLKAIPSSSSFLGWNFVAEWFIQELHAKKGTVQTFIVQLLNNHWHSCYSVLIIYIYASLARHIYHKSTLAYFTLASLTSLTHEFEMRDQLHLNWSSNWFFQFYYPFSILLSSIVISQLSVWSSWNMTHPCYC